MEQLSASLSPIGRAIKPCCTLLLCQQDVRIQMSDRFHISFLITDKELWGCCLSWVIKLPGAYSHSLYTHMYIKRHVNKNTDMSTRAHGSHKHVHTSFQMQLHIHQMFVHAHVNGNAFVHLMDSERSDSLLIIALLAGEGHPKDDLERREDDCIGNGMTIIILQPHWV